MELTVNGEKVQVADGLNLSGLLAAQKVENPDMVSVQVNGEFVEKDQYGSTQLQPGQEVDFLYFMGGGA
ncbi:MAG: thiamine biosynthesis protein ThiS [Candidatus Lambdaproteobacteria bacterium RIFOXYD1_FULL_56_27]|uniref:Thiamine biosynthesis protein ThiS n=1 Tax=Candidatus Lambdaproteobacteria bacterium RIFOXYD2_FULL_56_26 TaxID=1817773 RepID=A0A1F6H2T9_9PROT|nr:MAG: thiamine biosynthesis protein ThiS [Candidatus Lambdaproteobacteria bacterium RIFOXYD2_FULL_56_26]OGH05308.1 MAG: thiamine biosynthesis protein ThiS [Candidatus Lambdaproteobacteria bacterium RIFOXYC1_FULL_56_13]OGH09149.1 MAG: thiamine biosynthesis protein ThiS [Candidatus Lambdaproteobacteria bacterium RIFOXYD1_FULL_56_27]